MRSRTDEYKERAREHAKAMRAADPALHRLRVKASRDKALAQDPNFYKKKDLVRLYGVTFEWYKATLLKQKNVCAICAKPAEQNTTRRGKVMNLSVDHCHRTGVVRGLLCNNCNRAIGMLDHNRETLKAAQSYLAMYEGLT